MIPILFALLLIACIVLYERGEYYRRDRDMFKRTSEDSEREAVAINETLRKISRRQAVVYEVSRN